MQPGKDEIRGSTSANYPALQYKSDESLLDQDPWTGPLTSCFRQGQGLIVVDEDGAGLWRAIACKGAQLTVGMPGTKARVEMTLTSWQEGRATDDQGGTILALSADKAAELDMLPHKQQDQAVADYLKEIKEPTHAQRTPQEDRGHRAAEKGRAAASGGAPDRSVAGDGVPVAAPAEPARPEVPAQQGYQPLFATGPGADLAGLPPQPAAAPPPPVVAPPFGPNQPLATSAGDLYLFERCEAAGALLRLWVRPYAKPTKGVADLPLAESWGPGEALLQGGVRVLRLAPDEAVELGRMTPADQADAVRELFAEEGEEDVGEQPDVVTVSAGSDSPLLATLKASVSALLRDRPDRAVEVALMLRSLADEADPDHRTEAARQAQADRDLLEIADLRRQLAELQAESRQPPAATRVVIDAERDGYRRGREEAEAAQERALKEAYARGQDELLTLIADWLGHPQDADVIPERDQVEEWIAELQMDRGASCATCELREAELLQELRMPADQDWDAAITRVSSIIAAQQRAAREIQPTPPNPGRAACDAHAAPPERPPVDGPWPIGVPLSVRGRPNGGCCLGLSLQPSVWWVYRQGRCQAVRVEELSLHPSAPIERAQALTEILAMHWPPPEGDFANPDDRAHLIKQVEEAARALGLEIPAYDEPAPKRRRKGRGK